MPIDSASNQDKGQRNEPPSDVFHRCMWSPLSSSAKSCAPNIVMKDRLVPRGLDARSTYQILVIVSLR